MQKPDATTILTELIQLEFDAVHVYDTAIGGVDDERIRDRLRTFQQTHHDHVKNLSQELRQQGETPPVPSQDFKGMIFEKLAAIRSITGTEGALKALATAEEILSRYYQELVPEDMPQATHRILKKHLSDGQVHKDYIELNIGALSSTPPE